MGEIISGNVEFKRIYNRRAIRIYTFAAAIMLIGIGFFISGRFQTRKIERLNNSAYTRAITDFTSQICSVSASLEKMMYVTANEQAAEISAELFREVGLAQYSAGQLPLHNTDIDNMQRFLAQSGDYIFSLTKKLLHGGEFDNSDKNNIKLLYEYSDKLSSQLVVLQDGVNRAKSDKSAVSILQLSNIDTGKGTVAAPFADAEQIFSDYPRLIYDGPFSSDINEKPYKMLTKKKAVSSDEAKKIAAQFLNMSLSKMKFSGTTDSRLTSYDFEGDGKYIQISKEGGFIVSVLTDRSVTEEKITEQDALDAAVKYAVAAGYGNLSPTYYKISGGIMAVNLSPETDGITIYPDLVNVGIAMDNAELISLNAELYLKNHTNRQFPQEIIAPSEAKMNLTKNAELLNYSLTLIPTDYGSEILCYEFIMRNGTGREILVYINAETGVEEDILLLIDTGKGKLVM